MAAPFFDDLLLLNNKSEFMNKGWHENKLSLIKYLSLKTNSILNLNDYVANRC